MSGFARIFLSVALLGALSGMGEGSGGVDVKHSYALYRADPRYDSARRDPEGYFEDDVRTDAVAAFASVIAVGACLAGLLCIRNARLCKPWVYGEAGVPSSIRPASRWIYLGLYALVAAAAVAALVLGALAAKDASDTFDAVPGLTTQAERVLVPEMAGHVDRLATALLGILGNLTATVSAAQAAVGGGNSTAAVDPTQRPLSQAQADAVAASGAAAVNVTQSALAASNGTWVNATGSAVAAAAATANVNVSVTVALDDVAGCIGEARERVGQRVDEYRRWMKQWGWGLALALAIVLALAIARGCADGVWIHTRTRYKLLGLWSCVVLCIAVLTLAAAAWMLAAAIAVGSFCSDPTPLVLDYVNASCGPTSEAIVDYYLSCPAFNLTELDAAYPFAQQQTSVDAHLFQLFGLVGQMTASAGSPPSQTVLALQRAVSDFSVVHTGSIGTLGFLGPLGCHPFSPARVSPEFAAPIAAVCDTGYDELAWSFEMLLAAGILLLGLEVLHKCLRRATVMGDPDARSDKASWGGSTKDGGSPFRSPVFAGPDYDNMVSETDMLGEPRPYESIALTGSGDPTYASLASHGVAPENLQSLPNPEGDAFGRLNRQSIATIPDDEVEAAYGNAAHDAPAYACLTPPPGAGSPALADAAGYELPVDSYDISPKAIPAEGEQGSGPGQRCPMPPPPPPTPPVGAGSSAESPQYVLVSPTHVLFESPPTGSTATETASAPSSGNRERDTEGGAASRPASAPSSPDRSAQHPVVGRRWQTKRRPRPGAEAAEAAEAAETVQSPGRVVLAEEGSTDTDRRDGVVLPKGGSTDTDLRDEGVTRYFSPGSIKPSAYATARRVSIAGSPASSANSSIRETPDIKSPVQHLGTCNCQDCMA